MLPAGAPPRCKVGFCPGTLAVQSGDALNRMAIMVVIPELQKPNPHASHVKALA